MWGDINTLFQSKWRIWYDGYNINSVSINEKILFNYMLINNAWLEAVLLVNQSSLSILVC